MLDSIRDGFIGGQLLVEASRARWARCLGDRVMELAVLRGTYRVGDHAGCAGDCALHADDCVLCLGTAFGVRATACWTS